MTNHNFAHRRRTRRNSATFLAVSAAAALQVACSSGPPDAEKLTGIKGLNAKMEAANAAQERVTIAQARAHYAGFTVKSYDTSHGTQVEYTSPNGRCYLWYPGNRRVLPCKWKIIKKDTKPAFGQRDRTINVTHICFSYPKNSRNPVTGHRGSDWQCSQALATHTDQNGKITFKLPSGFHPATVDKVKGDRFRLAARKAVPFVLEKKKYSFAELKRLAN